MARRLSIVRLDGDGIGPEVLEQAVKVLETVASASDLSVSWANHPFGGASIDAFGVPLSDNVLSDCRDADGVLLGAIGGREWDDVDASLRPEKGLLNLRSALGAFANIRPVAVFPAFESRSPIRAAADGVDLVVVRELTGGIYFGEPSGRTASEAVDTMRYAQHEVERIAKKGFEMARRRSGNVVSVDKANVLAVSRLWREVVENIAATDYPDVSLSHMYVDNAAMQLVLNPSQFDVILTGNLFGDILSDVAATLPGSLGMLPSASVGGTTGIFEPVHGSAPDIAGQGKANPVAAVLSGALLLDDLGFGHLGDVVRTAVKTATEEGYSTPDICPSGGKTTEQVGDRISELVVQLASRIPAQA